MRSETELRRRTALLRGLAEIRAVTVTNGPGAGGRLIEVRTPCGLTLDIAPDRGGDLLRLAFRGCELGWHSCTGVPSPWPALDAEGGLGFLRGFDGFLVTCGLDHHGAPRETSAADMLYPLRRLNLHPLHGRFVGQRAEVLETRLDWEAGLARVRLLVTQAAVFSECLELERSIAVGLWEPSISLSDRVRNRGFRPVRHGILYHFNVGYPMLDEASRLTGDDWALRDRLDGHGAVPADDHVEIVDSGPAPAGGRIGIANAGLGLALDISFDPQRLPVAALWRAFQSGTFALGLEPQTRLADDDASVMLGAGEGRHYQLAVHVRMMEGKGSGGTG